MKKLALMLVFFAALFARAGTCSVNGYFNLDSYTNPIYCYENGIPVWKLTYHPDLGQVMVAHESPGNDPSRVWFLPFKIASQYAERSVVNEQVVRFNLSTGTEKQAWWVPFQFTGVD